MNCCIPSPLHVERLEEGTETWELSLGRRQQTRWCLLKEKSKKSVIMFEFKALEVKENLSEEYSQCTTRLFLILFGAEKAGCHTRQSSFSPFMLFFAERENWMETTPPLKLRLSELPSSSVSQESRGAGCPEERHEAAFWEGCPSTRMKGSREVMGMAGGEFQMIWDSDSWH